MERIPGIFFNRIDSVTPSDSAPVPGEISWLRIGGDGDLVIKGAHNASSVTIAVTAGEWIPFGKGNFVMAATTATGITAWGV